MRLLTASFPQSGERGIYRYFWRSYVARVESLARNSSVVSQSVLGLQERTGSVFSAPTTS